MSDAVPGGVDIPENKTIPALKGLTSTKVRG